MKAHMDMLHLCDNSGGSGNTTKPLRIATRSLCRWGFTCIFVVLEFTTSPQEQAHSVDLAPLHWNGRKFRRKQAGRGSRTIWQNNCNESQPAVGYSEPKRQKS